MGYPAEVMETGVLEAEIEAALKERPEPAVMILQMKQANTSLHGGVFKALALIYAGLLVIFWAAFQGDKEALFMVAISAVYLAAYMGTPFMLSRVGGRVDPVQEKSLAAFLKEPFETWTGVMSGREAALQILLIPSAILIAGAGMALIVTMSR